MSRPRDNKFYHTKYTSLPIEKEKLVIYSWPLFSIILKLCWQNGVGTLRRKSIGPFAVYSHKSEISILLEMNLKIGKFVFSSPISFENSGKSQIY